MMKAILAALCTLSLLATPVYSQEKRADEKKKSDEKKKAPTAAQKQQQEKMKDCNRKASARNLEGDERKNFMAGCLRSAPAAAGGEKKKMTEQQSKMKDCNKKANDRVLKGDERKNFMQACLRS